MRVGFFTYRVHQTMAFTSSRFKSSKKAGFTLALHSYWVSLRTPLSFRIFSSSRAPWTMFPPSLTCLPFRALFQLFRTDTSPLIEPPLPMSTLRDPLPFFRQPVAHCRRRRLDYFKFFTRRNTLRCTTRGKSSASTLQNAASKVCWAFCPSRTLLWTSPLPL